MPDIKYLEIACELVEEAMRGRSQETYCDLRECLQSMSQNWHHDRNANIEYTEELTRIAYIYGHMAANASLLEHVFGCADLQEYFDARHRERQKVEVCVFGAGPGTEVLGIAGWLKRRALPYPYVVDFTLFEPVDNWYETLLCVLNKVEERSQTRGISVNGQCHTFYKDAADLTRFACFDAAMGHDIYIFPYVLSEITERNRISLLKNFGSQLTDCLKPGAVLIFLDRYRGFEDHTKENVCAIIEGIAQHPYVDTGILPDAMLDNEWEVTRSRRFWNLRNNIDWWPRGKKIERKAFYTIAQIPEF